MRFLRRLFERELRLLSRHSRRDREARPGDRSLGVETMYAEATYLDRGSRGQPLPRPSIKELEAARAARAAARRRGPSLFVRLKRRLLPGFLGVTLSASAHAILLTIFFLLFTSTPVPVKRGPRELTIRLVPPGPSAPLEPEVTVLRPLEPPSEEPEEPQPETAAEAEVVEVAEKEAEPEPQEEESRELARAASGAHDLAAPPLPSTRPSEPSSLGVGGSPLEPSKGRGERHDLSANRGRRGRAEALRLYGGSGGTEDAVSRGLGWLAAHQNDDGKWDADGFSRHCPGFRDCDGPGKPELDIGVSALATLAFLGAGYSPREPQTSRSSTAASGAPSSGSSAASGPHPYHAVVRRGLDFLLDSQQTSGAFGSTRNRWFFYNHAIATLAVVEAYGLSRDSTYARAAKGALRYSADFQQEGGGWDYQPDVTGRNDLSITGWQVMAFSAARQVQLSTSRAMIRRTEDYLDGVVETDGWAIYARQGTGQGRKGVNMAAVGLLSRLYLGTSARGERVQRAVRILLQNPPSLEKAYTWDRFHQSSYYWYAATLCLFHLGGEPWEAWNHFVKREILPLQSERGHEAGSWDPDPNWVGTFGGRVTTTALLVLTMEVYYRYPPLHSYGK